MKKQVLSLIAVLTVAGSIMLASCTKSNNDLLDDYESYCTEAVEAFKNNDEAKFQSLIEKGNKLEAELNERDLTPEEVARFEQIIEEARAKLYPDDFN